MKIFSFQRAAFTVGYIQSKKYCENYVQYDLCKDTTRDCRIIENKPWKLF